jgi:hypothetical protein
MAIVNLLALICLRRLRWEEEEVMAVAVVAMAVEVVVAVVGLICTWYPCCCYYREMKMKKSS